MKTTASYVVIAVCVMMQASLATGQDVRPVRDSIGLTAEFSYRHWCGWFTEKFTLGGR